MDSPENLTERQSFSIAATLLFIFWIVLIAGPGTILLALAYFCVLLYARGPAVTSRFFEHLHNHHFVLPPHLFTTEDLFIVQGLSDMLLAAFILWRLPHVAGRTWHDLGLRIPTKRDLSVAISGTIVAFTCSSVIAATTQAITHQQVQQDTVKLMLNLPLGGQIAAALAAVVIAPIAEELAFRAFLFNALGRYMPRVAAIIISGIIFGIAHFQPAVAPELAVTGMVFATVYSMTGCLAANMIAHAMFNSISVIAIFFFHQTS